MRVELDIQKTDRGCPLAVRTNGHWSLTERGRKVHELVVLQKGLKAAWNPDFPTGKEKLAQREKLCGELGLPKEEKSRRQKIAGFDGRLRQMGFPYWRVRIENNEE